MAVSGVRMRWSELPAPVRARIEEIIGDGPVVAAQSQAGGFSPGSADRVRTASGRRAFVKAVSAAVNENAARAARREHRNTAAMPVGVPVPRLIGGFDDGGWVALVLEDVAGATPRTPWRETEIDAAVTALRELESALTPAPLPGLPTAGEFVAPLFTGWDRIAADPPAGLGPWITGRLADLRAAAAAGLAAVAAGGETMLHADIRKDNLLVRPDGRVVVVDWPWSCVGPAWLDTVLLAADVIIHGGDVERVLAGLDRRTAVRVITAVTGMYEDECRKPAPPGVPTLRAEQRIWATALLGWLRNELPGDARG
ncbi:phosphotransferase [Actinoplanes sp. NPDC051851]|uniref:phosphotransferase n=1 Tax=Actinoplanes sp. NPDC051851 TaxID=3154753 RepID=UPI003427F29B